MFIMSHGENRDMDSPELTLLHAGPSVWAYLWYWAWRNWNSSLMRSSVSRTVNLKDWPGCRGTCPEGEKESGWKAAEHFYMWLLGGLQLLILWSLHAPSVPPKRKNPDDSEGEGHSSFPHAIKSLLLSSFNDSASFTPPPPLLSSSPLPFFHISILSTLPSC